MDDGVTKGGIAAWASVYDGHGGDATAIWLKNKLKGFVDKFWANGAMVEVRLETMTTTTTTTKHDLLRNMLFFSSFSCLLSSILLLGGCELQSCIEEAFREADKKLLSPKGGFMGLGERGVGGSRCGATQTTAFVFTDPKDGKAKLVSANVGDGRTLLIRGGQALELSEEHVPDKEEERKRIERMNPNPKLPLVRYVAGTWRVGGLLALSRAFGDAYLKSSLQFEGVSAGSDGYSSGFGLLALPFVSVTELTAADSWIVVASDGLFNEEERGGGGGLSNADVAEILGSVAGASANDVAEILASTAQQVGSTDDVTVTLMKLNNSMLPKGK